MEIQRAAKETETVIVFLSRNSVDKEGYIQNKLRAVLNIAKDNPTGKFFIVPVRLDDCIMPRSLRIWQFIDLFPDDRIDRAYQRLLGILTIRFGEIGMGTIGDEMKKKPLQDRKIKKIINRNAEKQKGRLESVERNRKAVEIKARQDLLENAQGIGHNKPLSVARSATQTNPDSNERRMKTLSSPHKLSTKTKNILLRIGFGIGILLIMFYLIRKATDSPPLDFDNTMLVSEKEGMNLLYVPAGNFEMGSEEGDRDEKPAQIIYLDAYWIDQTEVTNAMYAKCVDAGNCELPNSKRSFMRKSYYDDARFVNYPVIFVSWEDAKNYCAWAGRRLPTEAEWEKAGRGTDGRIFPWGDVINKTYANFYENDVDTNAVGSFPNGKSFYGAYDMGGNVYEWTSSLYQPYPYEPDDGRENLSANGNRVMRGGNFISGYYNLRSASRDGSDPSISNPNLGFRCSLSAASPK